MTEPLIVERPVDGVLLVRLNRPERLNALDAAQMDRLERLWLRTAADEAVRCVVVTGTGRAFCTGADSSFLTAERAPRGAGLDAELSFLPGRQLDVPVIAAVNGICAGGGLHFVADADIVIATEDADFRDPHVSVGQVSGVEPASLALRLPVGIISRMALLGRDDRLAARRAYDLGLVSELTAADALVPRAVELASLLAANSPAAVAQTRRALRNLVDQAVEPAMRQGWDRVRTHWAHPDSVEGPAAFAERRPPVWGVR
jgi:enoyl-CoA hydratase/carnithine racemase